ncbi:MAG: flavoprotein [Candidatus Thorarchaeota archaeon]
MSKLLWGITGSGDCIENILNAMIRLQEDTDIQISVIVSKAGEQVLRWYRLWERLNGAFDKVKIETNANVPFVAGPLQINKYDLFVVAPLTANSTAKIAYGIADTLVTNAVAQTLKGTTKVLLFPVDQNPIEVETRAPNGTVFKIRPRQVDLDNVTSLRAMTNVVVVRDSDELFETIRNHAKGN